MKTKRTTKKAGTAAKKTPKASPATKTSGRRAAKKATPAKGAPATVAGVLKLPAIGEKMTRAHRGKDHVVEVVEGGFKYEGRIYASLTALAKEITGYKAISGPAFFGLWRRSTGAK